MGDVTHGKSDESGERHAHEARRIAKARESAAAGRIVPLAEMVAWAHRLDGDEFAPVPRSQP
jgi:hypothetical protein